MQCHAALPRVRKSSLSPTWAMGGRAPTFAGPTGDVADACRVTAAGVRDSSCTWADGPSGKELACDGTGSAITLANWPPPGTGSARTYLIWFRADSLAPAYSGLIGEGTGSGRLDIMLTSAGKIAIYCPGLIYDGSGPVTMAKGTYHFLQVALGVSSALVTVDGVVDFSGASASLPSIPDSLLALGYDPVSGRPFTGRIAAAALFNYPLGLDEQVALFANPNAHFARPGRTRRRSYSSPSTARTPWLVSRSPVLGSGVY